MTLEQLHYLTAKWSQDRGITTNGKSSTQALKLVSEVGELADNIIKGNCTKDDIGDCLVVLTNLSILEGHSLIECWEHAYNDIKNRKGYLTKSGNFVKDTDPNYKEIIKNDQNK